MIYQTANTYKYIAIQQPMVNMASFGALELYDNKSNIRYPYVNFDVVSAQIINGIKRYVFRIYVCDRNEPYIAYNKTELILDNILRQIDVPSYTVNYFNLNFQDVVNGVWADFVIDIPRGNECYVDTITGDYILTEETFFVLLENGDLVRLEVEQEQQT